MFIVSLLILCAALIFTPFPQVKKLSSSSDTQAKRSSWLSALLTRKKPTTIRKNIESLKRNREKNADLGLVVSEAATRLRSGANLEEAWYQSLRGSYGDSCERGIDEYGVPLALRALWKKPRRFFSKKSFTDQTQLAIPAAIAVCRLSHSSGAPIADVLDSCASGISEAAEAESARSVALAGPQTSAQMLAWLPLIGVVLGSALGAEPLHFLFSTTAGLCVFFLGLACEITGIIWVRKLSQRAENI